MLHLVQNACEKKQIDTFFKNNHLLKRMVFDPTV
jgi:hypothetical protein